MNRQYLEFTEHLHLYVRDGKVLFAGTPDRVLRFPKEGVTIVVDHKFGRGEIPTADVNMQLRSYLVMVPEAEFESEVPQGYSTDFRPSSLLRFKLCPGSLTLQRQMNAQGLLEAGPSEDAAEGTKLHKAIAARNAPRDDLTPEQLDMVEKAERMEREFIDFVFLSEPLLSFYGAIIQPRISSKADIVFYTPHDIRQARAEIDAIWDAAHVEGAPRNPSSDACKFCPCKPICPEYKSWVMAVEKIQHLPASTWSADQWNLFLSRRGELERFLKERYEDAKAIVKSNPQAIPGWELKDGNKVRKVSNIPAAWAALSDLLNAQQFSDCCKVSLGDIEETLWRIKRDTSQRITQKEAGQIINAKLGNLIELKQNAPSLVKKDEK